MNEVKVKGIYVLIIGRKVIAIRLELEDGQQLIIHLPHTAPIQKKEEIKKRR